MPAKNHINSLYLTFLLIITLPFSLIAQDSYAVLNTGDTIYGEIMINTITDKGLDKITIKNGKNRKIYNSLTALKFYLDGSEYETIKLSDRYVYAKVISRDYLSVLKVRGEKGADFAFDVLKKIDGSTQEVPNIGFKRYISEFLSDCDKVSLLVSDGTYKRTDLETIVKEYNDCFDKKKIISSEINTVAITEMNQSFKTLLEEIQGTDLESKQEIMEIIKDIQKKKNASEPIPGYLKGAIQEKLNSRKDLLDRINELIEK